MCCCGCAYGHGDPHHIDTVHAAKHTLPRPRDAGAKMMVTKTVMLPRHHRLLECSLHAYMSQGMGGGTRSQKWARLSVTQSEPARHAHTSWPHAPSPRTTQSMSSAARHCRSGRLLLHSTRIAAAQPSCLACASHQACTQKFHQPACLCRRRQQ